MSKLKVLFLKQVVTLQFDIKYRSIQKYTEVYRSIKKLHEVTRVICEKE